MAELAGLPFWGSPAPFLAPLGAALTGLQRPLRPFRAGSSCSGLGCSGDQDRRRAARAPACGCREDPARRDSSRRDPALMVARWILLALSLWRRDGRKKPPRLTAGGLFSTNAYKWANVCFTPDRFCPGVRTFCPGVRTFCPGVRTFCPGYTIYTRILTRGCITHRAPPFGRAPRNAQKTYFVQKRGENILAQVLKSPQVGLEMSLTYLLKSDIMRIGAERPPALRPPKR